MSEGFVFGAGCLATLLCSGFFVLSWLELRRLGREAEERGEGPSGRG